MTLYELTGDFQTLYDMADDPEIDEQAWLDTIEGIDGAIEDKADGYAKVIKELMANADAIKAERERMDSRESALRNRADTLKRPCRRAWRLQARRSSRPHCSALASRKTRLP